MAHYEIELGEFLGRVNKAPGYRKDPGNFDKAAWAAYSAAGDSDAVLVPGNSYMNKVFHVSRAAGLEIASFLGCSPDRVKVAVIKPSGEVFSAVAKRA